MRFERVILEIANLAYGIAAETRSSYISLLSFIPWTSGRRWTKKVVSLGGCSNGVHVCSVIYVAS